MNISSARTLFLGLKNKTFLDTACVGLAPITAQKAIHDFMSMAIACNANDCTEHHIEMDILKDNTLIEAKKTFNAQEKNLCLIESTTHGLNIAANSIPFKKNDEVIILNAEYIQVALPFTRMEREGKLKIKPLSIPHNEEINIDHFERLLSSKTKAICISAVLWSTGERVFTKELAQLCKQKDIFLIVDGIQEAGALAFDAHKKYCDFYIAGGHKWLNSPYGCGLMYMSDKSLNLYPPMIGYLNLNEPQNGWQDYFQNPTSNPFVHYTLPKRAKSFGIGGTGNYLGAIGLAQALKILNDVGVNEVEQQVISLSQMLKNYLADLGLQIVSPFNKNKCSGITVFRTDISHEHDISLLNYLISQKILVSIRYSNGSGGIRISTHYYNNEEDIKRLCEHIKLWLNNTSLSKFNTAQVVKSPSR